MVYLLTEKAGSLADEIANGCSSKYTFRQLLGTHTSSLPPPLQLSPTWGCESHRHYEGTDIGANCATILSSLKYGPLPREMVSVKRYSLGATTLSKFESVGGDNISDVS